MGAALAFLAASGAVAEDRTVPIISRCAGLDAYYLDRTVDAGDGWVRAVIATVRGVSFLTEVNDHMARLVWDVRCADGRLASVGRGENKADAAELVGAAPVGAGEWPSVRCAPDQTFPGVAEMICAYHARAGETQ